jgi:hypothetical protein
MRDFQYTPFVNPYAGSIADEIARSGDAQARAAMAIGQAQARASEIRGAGWGRAIANIGQIPAQIQAQQYADTDRKLKEQELAMTIEQRQQVQAQRVATLTGRIAGVSSSPAVFADRLDQAVKSGLLPAEIGDHVKQQIAAAGPEGFPALQKSYVDFAASFEAPVKLGENEQLVRPSTGAVVASGPRKPIQGAPGTVFFNPPDAAHPDAALTPIGEVPKTEVVNGQPLSVSSQGATAVGPAVPKQETPSEVAQRQAQTLKLQREAAEIDQKLAGTTPMSRKDKAELEIRRAQIALETARNDRMERKEDVSNPRYQGQLENQYRTLARVVVSSRNGTLGVEDQKVAAAKHLVTMFDANTDKNGIINIPPQQYQELVTGLATLVNPRGVPTEGQIEALRAATAKGDFGKLAQYLTGSNFNGTTQEIAKYLRDQVERQGIQAEANREKELDFIRQSRPTDLEPARAEGIERGLAGLNRMADVGVGVPKDGTAGTIDG